MGNTPSGFTAPVLPRSRALVLRARRGAPHFVRALKYGAASRLPPPALPFSGPNGEGPTPKAKCEVRSAKAGCPNGKGCVGSDAGRQAKARRVGSTQRRKEGRKAASHKEFLAAWRTWRLGVRSGCRDLTPVGAADTDRREPPPFGQHALRFHGSRSPALPRSRSPGPARGASLRSGSEMRGGIPSSRASALPFSGPNGEGPTPKGEVRSAKSEVRVVRMARAVSDRTLAGRRMPGGLVPRKDAKYAKPPPTKNSFAAWRTWRLRVRSGCRVLTPVGAHRSEAATHKESPLRRGVLGGFA